MENLWKFSSRWLPAAAASSSLFAEAKHGKKSAIAHFFPLKFHARLWSLIYLTSHICIKCGKFTPSHLIPIVFHWGGKTYGESVN